MPRKSSSRVSVAEAKRSLSELLGRVAFSRESITILKRGRPMAKLVPVEERERRSLADVRGWLPDDDPFFAIMEEIIASRHAVTNNVAHFRRTPALRVEDWMGE